MKSPLGIPNLVKSWGLDDDFDNMVKKTGIFNFPIDDKGTWDTIKKLY